MTSWRLRPNQRRLSQRRWVLRVPLPRCQHTLDRDISHEGAMQTAFSFRDKEDAGGQRGRQPWTFPSGCAGPVPPQVGPPSPRGPPAPRSFWELPAAELGGAFHKPTPHWPNPLQGHPDPVSVLGAGGPGKSQPSPQEGGLAGPLQSPVGGRGAQDKPGPEAQLPAGHSETWGPVPGPCPRIGGQGGASPAQVLPTRREVGQDGGAREQEAEGAHRSLSCPSHRPSLGDRSGKVTLCLRTDTFAQGLPSCKMREVRSGVRTEE